METEGEREQITVLICDDHPAFARGLAKLLELEAADVEVVATASTAAEAARLVSELLPDVVLMDIRMPVLDGIEATRRVRAASPSTRVVALTASEEQADLYQALRAGATGYVVKDNELTEIVGAVRAVCRGHLVIPAHLAADFMRDVEGADRSLSDAERDILAAIARGETNREIGMRLHMSERTVRRRVEDLYSKLHLSDRIEAAVYAGRQGISGR